MTRPESKNGREKIDAQNNHFDDDIDGFDNDFLGVGFRLLGLRHLLSL